MDKNKRQRLEAKGRKVGTVDEFLGLTPDEATYVELKLTLSERVREYRQARRLTQVEMAPSAPKITNAPGRFAGPAVVAAEARMLQ